MQGLMCGALLVQRGLGFLVEAPTSFLLMLSLRTEEKKPLSARTLPRRPYKLLLATLTNLYQQLDQSEKLVGLGGWKLLLASNLQFEWRVQGVNRPSLKGLSLDLVGIK